MTGWLRWLVGLILLAAIAGGFCIVAMSAADRPAESHALLEARDAAKQVTAEGPQESGDAPSGFRIGPMDTFARFVRTSPDGLTYIVVSYWSPGDHHGGLPEIPHYAVLRRAADAGSTAWPSETLEESPERVSFADIVQGPDFLVGRGLLHPATSTVHLLDDGRFVAVARHVTVEPLVCLRQADGTRSWALPGSAVFGTEFTRTFADAPVTWGPEWCKAAWPIHARGLLLLLGWNDQLRALEIESGEVVAREDLRLIALESLLDPRNRSRDVILDAARRGGWPGRVEVASKLLDDHGVDRHVRFRAAIALVADGDASGLDLILDMSRDPMPARPEPWQAWALTAERLKAEDDGETALRWLGPALGDAALSIYVSTLKEAGDLWSVHGALAGLGSMGPLAADAILDWFLDRPESEDRQRQLSDPLQRLRDDESHDIPFRAPRWSFKETHASWQALLGGDARGLEGLLRAGTASESGSRWSAMAPAALRYVRMHPAATYAATIVDFRTSFAAHPDGTPEWQALVLREADAALAACAAAP